MPAPLAIGQNLHAEGLAVPFGLRQYAADRTGSVTMARKIVAVPFVYEADVRPPRARNTRTVRIRDEIGVVVRDLAPEDFPVALRAAEAGNTHYGQVDDIRWDG